MTDRRPVYFEQPVWPVAGVDLACLACACLRQAGAGRPDGLF